MNRNRPQPTGRRLQAPDGRRAGIGEGKRRRPESNRCIKVLQTSPLPLGYGATVASKIAPGVGFVKVQYPQERRLPSNADLQDLLAKAMTRLENWRLELETNPSPRMVHALRNILGHMESIARVTETKAAFSYKHLSRQMSLLIGAVAELNLAITESLDDDDLIDAREEQRINASLKRVVEAAVEMIRIVQHGFVLSRGILDVTAAAGAGPAVDVRPAAEERR